VIQLRLSRFGSALFILFRRRTSGPTAKCLQSSDASQPDLHGVKSPLDAQENQHKPQGMGLAVGDSAREKDLE